MFLSNQPCANPITECIGSRVYQMLGIPVHHVSLDVRDNRVILNRKYPDMNISPMSAYLTPPDTDGVEISIIIDFLWESCIFRGTTAMRDFWRMFVIDALLGNPNRNLDNWAYIANSGKPAPVYANDTCLCWDYNEDQMRELIFTDMYKLAIEDVKSYFTMDGKHINPFKFLAETQDLLVKEALDYVVWNGCVFLLDGVVSVLDFISPAMQEFYVRLLSTRYNYLQAIREGRELPTAEGWTAEHPAEIEIIMSNFRNEIAEWDRTHILVEYK